MPRKTTKSSRQHGGQRRAVSRTARPAGTPAPLGTAPATTSTVATASAPVAQERPVRRPASNPSGTTLSSEQVGRELRYIRRDIVKLLITTAVVLLFIIAANLAIN